MERCRWIGSHYHDWIDYNGVAPKNCSKQKVHLAITLSKIRLDLFASESLKTSTIGILTLRNKADAMLFFISLFIFYQIKQTQNMKAYVVIVTN